MGVAVAMMEPPKIGRPLLFATPELMQEAIDAYYKDCETRQVPLTMSGLADALDTSRKVICEYEGRDEFSNTIKRARRKVERQVEEAMLTRDRQVAGHIFNLKNNFGWRDVQEVENTHTVIVVGQPGHAAAQLEPPTFDVSPLPVLQLEAKPPQNIEENSTGSHNPDSVNRAKLLTRKKKGKKA